MRKLFLPLFILLVLNSKSQVKWPAVTNQTKPWTRWWWIGSQVKKPDLTTVMQQYQQVGLGGLEITPIYGVQKEEDQYIPFLSPQWMDVFGHTLKEGKRLNLGIDLANATGWPFGGPWIGEEDASKNMQLKTYTLNGGESLTDTIKYIQEPMVRTENGKPVKVENLLQPISANKNLQQLAIDQVRFVRPLPLQTLMAFSDAGEKIDLTNKVDAAGKLNWTAPAGKWNLYALFMGWHGKQVERAAPGGEGYVIDHFSAPALQHYLKRFDEAFRGFDISYLRAFFNDSYEVDDARGQSNYTPKLFDEFKKRRGYDLRNELPALFTKNHTERTNRILCDYRMTIDELILEDFTGEWKKWAQSKGKMVRNQSHGSPANTLDLYGVVDIPETEGTEILRIKFAPSTSHVMGKQLAASESATWLNEHFVSSLSDVKKALDVYFIGGVNHIVYHGTTYSPPSETWPGRLFYAAVEFDQANPFWNNFAALNTYVTRTQSFLQQGKPDNDVLLYFPIYDKYSEPGRDLLLHFDGMKPDFNGTPFEISATMMQEKGYAFDYISDRQIVKLTSAGGKINTGGVSYQTIVLPDAKFMKAETFKHLIDLAKAGATIIALKKLPSDVPGFAQLEENTATLKTLTNSLHFQFIDGAADVQMANIGKGRILLGGNLEELLQSAKVRKETMAAKGLQFSRRKIGVWDTYFIANRSGKKMDQWVKLQTVSNAAVLYNPMTGQAGLAETRRTADNFIEVHIPFNTDESFIVQTVHTKYLYGNGYPYIKSASTPTEIKGEWTLSFTEGGPALPAAVKLSALQPWTNFEDNSYKIFSGTASYNIRFKKPEGNAAQYILDLGKVYESAEVFINGKKMATSIGPDYTVTIAANVLQAENSLEIKVANSMANRIIDLDKRKVFWKKFNNTNFPARLAQNRGPDNIFDASKWEPKISGLAGPVTLTAVK